MRREIQVENVAESTYRVTVDEDETRTVHDVTATAEAVARYAPGVPAPDLIKKSFEFLLEREPKESILPRFELSVIQRYFPDYPREIRRRV